MDKDRQTAAAAWAMVIGFSLLVGLVLGWRVGFGVIGATLFYGGLVQLINEVKGK